jgi:predicted transcriptional regulator
MSPRAACRLEALGFEHVYDYSLGIADWKAAGLPLEGDVVESQDVADATRSDIPIAAPEELVGPVADRATSEGWDEALVLDCDGVVVGRLRGTAWDQDRDLPVETVMELGPTTVRPNSQLAPLVKRMQKRDTKLVTVTTPQGVLIGVLLRSDAERVLEGESAERIWADCDGCPGHWVVQ